MSGIGIEESMHEVHRDRKKTSFGPFEFVLPFALSEGCVSAPRERVNNMLAQVMALDESLAFGNLPNCGVHVDVPREVQVYAAASDVGPGLDLLSLRVEDRIPFDHWSLAGLDPIAIEIPFQTAPTADIGWTEFLAFLCFRSRLRRDFREREVGHRKG